jgi:hypothetical protein
MKVLFADTDFWNDKADLKKKYEAEVTKAFNTAHKLLPVVSEKLSFVVQDNPRACIPETGDGARTYNAILVILSFDPALPYGEKDLLEHIKASVFHEMNHAARFSKPIWHKNLLEWCLMEGLATVFERDRADCKPLWGEYPENTAEWLEEVKKAKDSEHDKIMFRHPDGRRWIGYKVGTYITDEAMKKSGKTIEEITALECDEIFKLAGV